MEQWGRWGLPEAASDRAPFIGNLWNGAWIASMVIGVIVWALIGWAVFRYRRRSDDEVPRQIKYNLPMEIMYTLVPFLIKIDHHECRVKAEGRVRIDGHWHETGPMHGVLEQHGGRW